MKYLLHGCRVVTMNARRDILDADILVDGDRIAALGPDIAVLPEARDAERVDMTGRVLLPGLIQAHMHVTQILFRGLCDDLELMDWLEKRTWPLEGAHSAASNAVSARLAALELIRSGKYDFLICEMSEAQLGSALVRGVEQVYTFDEPLAMSAVISSQEQREDFKAWLSHFRGSEEYAMLNDLYFERGIVGRVMGQGLTAKNAGGISSYDDLFRDMCEKEGYDWRLISAIAYSESRFNPYVVSRKGAKGLMQVMPRVARQFGVQGDLMDPENNVLLALKVLGKIEKSLDFAPGTSSADRMKIVLACYNAGLGHVLDARSLARKYGANPDSWSDVSTYLSLKSDPEVVKDDAVKCGRFNSSQTLAFVNKVFSKYTTYCNNISR